MRRVLVAISLITAGGLSIGAAALQQPAKLPPVRDIQKVRDNLYFISGGDTYDRARGPAATPRCSSPRRASSWSTRCCRAPGPSLLARIKSVTDKPVTTIINTHTHFDHSGSNTEFPATVEFVAHENTRANMAQAKCEPVTNCDAFKGDNAKYLPKRTYKDRLTLFSGKDQIDLYHFGRGHTSGDTFVVFPAVRAMHAGDMFPRAHMPFIDFANNGGAAVEFNDTLQKAVSTIKNVETVIGGHTPVAGDLERLRDLHEFYDDFLAAAQRGA